MTITGQPAMSLLDSVMAAETTRVDVNVGVLKKAQDAEKQQGEAVVKLLEAAGAPPTRAGLDVYA
ncbi:MAG: putative motility protein [Verrucomicrobiota bacterium]